MNDGTTGVNFVHLHNHSYFSIFDGMASPDDLAATAAREGFPAIALTDHGTMGGVYAFQKACKKYGVKPILGNEVYMTNDLTEKHKDTRTYHLTLIAKNSTGLKNLFKLSTIAELEGKYKKPRLDFDTLSKHHEGIICLSGCPSGELSMNIWQEQENEVKRILSSYKDLFGDDYYIEIMTHKYNPTSKGQEERERVVAKKLYQLAKEFDIKPVATNDAHYANAEDAEYHDVLLAIQTNSVVKDPDRFRLDGNEFYLKSYEEMKNRYSSAPELLANTVEVAEKIEANLIKEDSDLLPHYDIPTEFNSDEAYLKELVKDGMRSFGLMNKPEYRERIKFEMEAIIRCGYVRYFLILWDIINYANNQGIRVGVGRGSAVGSLTLYVLGITKLDPLKYDLLFERFINPERISPPDVDIDFDYYRRDEIFEYVTRKYGKERCCKIGTYNSLKARAVTRYVAKALDIGNDWDVYQAKKKNSPNSRIEMTKRSLDLADFLAKQIPDHPGITIEMALKEDDAFRNSIMKYPELLDNIKKLEGTISSAGVHPAGILICKDPIVDHVAMRESKQQIASVFDGPEVEEIGLLKFDFLALKTLTVVEDTIQMIKQYHGKDINVDLLEPNDPKVFKLLNGGYPKMDNRGIFQFESQGISSLLRRINVDRFEDMIVANALYRPGPLKAKVDDMYCDYKHGRQAIRYLHPKMGEVLDKSYGLMVYQENFMKVAQELAGFSRGQSDILRKAVGKKKQELLAEQKTIFVEGCVKNGIEKSIAEKIFEQIDYFGGYGFNKSHSAAYAFLAYQTAWLKVYYPMEFMCALLSSEIQNNDKGLKLKSYIKQAEDMGIVIIRADINKSGMKYQIEERIGTKGERKGKRFRFLRTPLTTLDGVGRKAVEEIVEHAPYKNLNAFLHDVDGRKVTSKVFTALAEQDCMKDAFRMEAKEILAQYDKTKAKVKKEKQAIQKEQQLEEELGGSIFDRF